MAGKSHQKRKTLLKRLAIVVTLIVAIGCSTANFAALIVLEHQLQSMLQLEASVGSVHLSLSQICIRNIRVSGASSEDPLLTIAEVNVGLTISNGLSNGIWASEVKVSEPTLHLKFSRTGELLTQLPQPAATEGGDGAIPIQRLKVVRGAMEISQAGAPSFRTANAAAAIEFGESIRIAAVLPNLLGGLWKLSGELDAKSFAGGLGGFRNRFIRGNS